MTGLSQNAKQLNPICKCCGGSTSFFAQYDFSRTCEDHKAPVSPSPTPTSPTTDVPRAALSSHPTSTAGPEREMSERIYNSDYVLADPEFTAARPEYIANELDKMPAPVRDTIDILDYGGGEGRLIEELGKRGFKKSRLFDPFFSSGRSRTGNSRPGDSL